jgi:RimJ/RimL family protein N-acetyltransferase
MPQSPFVPPDFDIPKTLETSEFRLRMLTIHDVVKDYDAVMTSAAHLQQLYLGKWPEGLTLEQNLIELGWHHHEFQRRTSFAYTVVTPSEDRVLGCVYINPTPKRDHDATVHLWARESELQGGLEERLLLAVRDWVAGEWPFKNVAYPGRDMTWEEYRALPEL